MKKTGRPDWDVFKRQENTQTPYSQLRRLNITELSNHSNIIHMSRKAKRIGKRAVSRSLTLPHYQESWGTFLSSYSEECDLGITVLASLHPLTHRLLQEEGLFWLADLEREK